eukprot:TRINITY_DN13442_c1_g1_i1.p1 TRINITY_DN13442_c1_g1~~TRINITY_DN13442_c1_g1_i1.p1  ORF type:complete len:323 (+),score=115.58 TRINITY_DN13442_c1_g1_i1:182-1150(+)
MPTGRAAPLSLGPGALVGAGDSPPPAEDASPSRRRPPPKLSLTGSVAELSLSPAGETWTPAAGRACIVLDFDLTLASIHVYKELRKLGFGAQPSELGQDMIFGGATRHSMLVNFLTSMRQRRCHVAVLTNNSEDTVVECLRLGGLLQFVDQVISVDPSSTKGRDFSRLRPPGVSRWVFADDDTRNIRSVERETRRRVPCVLVEGGCGLQARHLAAIEEAAFPPQFNQTCGSDLSKQPSEGVANLSLQSVRASEGSGGDDSDHDRTVASPATAESLGATVHRALSTFYVPPEEDGASPQDPETAAAAAAIAEIELAQSVNADE